MKHALLTCLLAVACSGSGAGDPCSPAGTATLDLVYTSGDCVQSGLIEELNLFVDSEGATVQAFADGEPVDSTAWNAGTCTLSIESGFWYPETADAWEIDGTVTLEIDYSATPPEGFGHFEAVIYKDTGETECTQIIEVNWNKR